MNNQNKTSLFFKVAIALGFLQLILTFILSGSDYTVQLSLLLSGIAWLVAAFWVPLKAHKKREEQTAAEETRQRNMARYQQIANGTWAFPWRDFYAACRDNGVLDLATPQDVEKARQFADAIMVREKIPPAYYDLYHSEARMRNYLSAGRTAEQAEQDKIAAEKKRLQQSTQAIRVSTVKPIVIMKLETALHDFRCDDGELRTRFYEITDQGTVIQYLAALEDRRDEFILEAAATLRDGSEGSYQFSVVEARGVGTSPTYGVPITYSTGLSYLKFNGDRIASVKLYPSSGGKSYYPLFGKGEDKLHPAAKSVMKGAHENFLFSDKWIEEKFGRARGFFEKYTYNSYGNPTSEDTLNKHIALYSRIISYYCGHRGEISGLDAYYTERIKSTSGIDEDEVFLGRYKPTFDAAQYDPQRFVSDADSEAGKADREALLENMKRIRQREQWYAEQIKPLDELEGLEEAERSTEEKRLAAEAEAAFPRMAYQSAVKDPALLNGIAQVRPAAIAAQKEKGDCIVRLLYLMFEDCGAWITKDLCTRINIICSAVWDDAAEPLQADVLNKWLNEFSSREPERLARIDEKAYLGDLVWIVAKAGADA